MGTRVCRRRKVIKDRNPQGLKPYWSEMFAGDYGSEDPQLQGRNYKEETGEAKDGLAGSVDLYVDLLGRQLSLSAVVRSGC